MWLVSRATSQTIGATPLLIASQEGHVECVRALLDGGAAINQATVGSSCCKCWTGVVFYLGLGVRAVGCHSLCQVYGTTPLAVARSRGRADMVALLSSRGAL